MPRDPGDDLDLTLDAVALTADLVDRPSVSGTEGPLADAVERALKSVAHLQVHRDGDAVVARTEFGHAERVVIGGHLDTVPEAGNLAARFEGDRLYGLGSCDMKGGVAVGLHLAATLTEPNRDITYIFYDNEEVAAEFNGLGRLSRNRPELLGADFAVLMEPSNASVEAGCQGTLRVEVRTKGVRAHSARAWRGVNAIHGAAEVLNRLNGYEPRKPVIDGLTYHEGLSAVRIGGGVAGNVIPDECVITVNHRFAPDRSGEEALAFVREYFDGYDVTCVDLCPGALPGLGRPAAAAFLATTGGEATPKFGWTDVALFSGLGVPAVNFGPGDPNNSHTVGEYVEVAEIRRCADVLRAWLTRLTTRQSVQHSVSPGLGEQFVGAQPGLVAPHVGHHHELVGIARLDPFAQLLAHARLIADHHEGAATVDRDSFARGEPVLRDLLRALQRSVLPAPDAQPRQVHRRGQPLGLAVRLGADDGNGQHRPGLGERLARCEARTVGRQRRAGWVRGEVRRERVAEPRPTGRGGTGSAGPEDPDRGSHLLRQHLDAGIGMPVGEHPAGQAR